METGLVVGQARIREQGDDRPDILHVQVGKPGSYEKLDFPLTDAIEQYVADQQDAGNVKLSLAGSGNHDDYVPIGFIRRTETVTVTREVTRFYPVEHEMIDEIVHTSAPDDFENE